MACPGTRALFFSLGGLTLVLANHVRAETPGERVIRQMDQAMTRAKDQSYTYDITTQEPGKAPRKMSMNVKLKGTQWRRVEFLSPGDVKGMKVLILSLSQMYVYLPAYHKIRRVAGHVRSQSFMGTALSQDDMSIVTYGDVFQGKLLSETKTHWRVEGGRRPGKDFPYGKLEFLVRKDMQQPSEIHYYSDKGVKLKTETRGEYECRSNICGPRVLKMVDHTRNGLWTELSQTQWQINTGVPDSYFTPHSLQSGR
jgi:hypothetical protein